MGISMPSLVANHQKTMTTNGQNLQIGGSSGSTWSLGVNRGTTSSLGGVGASGSTSSLNGNNSTSNRTSFDTPKKKTAVKKSAVIDLTGDSQPEGDSQQLTAEHDLSNMTPNMIDTPGGKHKEPLSEVVIKQLALLVRAVKQKPPYMKVIMLKRKSGGHVEIEKCRIEPHILSFFVERWCGDHLRGVDLTLPPRAGNSGGAINMSNSKGRSKEVPANKTVNSTTHTTVNSTTNSAMKSRTNIAMKSTESQRSRSKESLRSKASSPGVSSSGIPLGASGMCTPPGGSPLATGSRFEQFRHDMQAGLKRLSDSNHRRLSSVDLKPSSQEFPTKLSLPKFDEKLDDDFLKFSPRGNDSPSPKRRKKENGARSADKSAGERSAGGKSAGGRIRSKSPVSHINQMNQGGAGKPAFGVTNGRRSMEGRRASLGGASPVSPLTRRMSPQNAYVALDELKNQVMSGVREEKAKKDAPKRLSIGRMTLERPDKDELPENAPSASGERSNPSRTSKTFKPSPTHRDKENAKKRAQENTENRNGTTRSTNSGTNSGAQSASTKSAGEKPCFQPPPRDISSVADFKSFFAAHKIDVSNVMEKSEFFEMKTEFDDLWKTLGPEKAAEQMRAKYNINTLSADKFGNTAANGGGGAPRTNSYASTGSGISGSRANSGTNSATSGIPTTTQAKEPTAAQAKQDFLSSLKNQKKNVGPTKTWLNDTSAGGGAGGPSRPSHQNFGQPNARTGAASSRAAPAPYSAPSPAVNTGPMPPVVAEAMALSKIPEIGNSWAWKSLGLNQHTDSTTEETFKTASKKLLFRYHPDKCRAITNEQQKKIVELAYDKISRAKSIVEDELKRKGGRVPATCTRIDHVWINRTPGRRALKLTWNPPFNCTPRVEKYTLQLLDPAFGRFLTFSVLESFYDADAQKFMDISELTFCQLEEANMGKLAHIFQGPKIDIQISAHNNIGAGEFVRYTINNANKIAAMPPTSNMMSRSGGSSSSANKIQPSSSSSVKSATRNANSSNPAAEIRKKLLAATKLEQQRQQQQQNAFGFAPATPGATPGARGSSSGTAATAKKKADISKRVAVFDREMKSRFSILETEHARKKWLTTQNKSTRMEWLAERGWPASNVKATDDLDNRILTYLTLNQTYLKS